MEATTPASRRNKVQRRLPLPRLTTGASPPTPMPRRCVLRADRGSVAGAAVGELCSYQQLRGWIDELEFAALNGDYEHQNIVIPNEGRAIWRPPLYTVRPLNPSISRLLRAANSAIPMSPLRWRQQRMPPSIPGAGRDRREYLLFLSDYRLCPGKRLCLNWSMAGNTGAYTGSDPSVPKEAYEYSRCGTSRWKRTAGTEKW